MNGGEERWGRGGVGMGCDEGGGSKCTLTTGEGRRGAFKLPDGQTVGRGKGTFNRHTAVVQDMHNLPGRRSNAHEEDRRGIVQSEQTMSPTPQTKSSRQRLLTQCNSPTGKSPARFVRRCAWRVRRPCRTSTHQHPFHPREQAKEGKRPPGAQRDVHQHWQCGWGS